MPERDVEPQIQSRPPCRHCRQPIRRGNSGTWVHVHHLNRCRQPEHVPVYGYEAMPYDGEECVCWACLKYGPVGFDIDALVVEAEANDA